MTPSQERLRLEPLLKWPGGKRKIAHVIASYFPRSIHRYYEPFFGGGALYFMLQPQRATLSDINGALIDCYAAIRDDAESVIKALARMPNTEGDYYRIRASRPITAHSAAARLIYLCTYSFNGIYRENLRGEYNVPYGYKINHPKPSPKEIRAIAEALGASELATADFAAATSHAAEGDLVYFDPPYTLKHSNNGFVKYNASLFTWHDQLRLAETAAALSRRGVHVVVSNASHDSIRALYPHFHEVAIERHSVIAAAAEKRARVVESLFLCMHK